MGSNRWMAVGMIAGASVGILLGTEGMIVALVAGAVIGHLVDRTRREIAIDHWRGHGPPA